MNFQQLQDDVLIRLGEAQSALVAAYMPGTNAATPVTGYTTAQVIGGWINDGQNDLARNYYPVADDATYTWPAGQRLARFSKFTCTDSPNNTLIGVRRITMGGVALTYGGRGATENWHPTMDTDAQGQPVEYYPDGVEGIGVYPIPNTPLVATARGIVTPAPLVNPTDIPVFAVDRHMLLSCYACGMCLMRNTEDPELQSRGGALIGLYREQAQAILARVQRLDPDLARDLLAVQMLGGQGQ